MAPLMARLWPGFGLGCLSRMHMIYIIDSKRWGEIVDFELWLLNHKIINQKQKYERSEYF
jgi:hypothetical protein